MNKITVDIVNKSGNDLPEYATEFSSGLDLRADFTLGIKEEFLFQSNFYAGEELVIFAGGRALIPTNLHTAIPEEYEFQIRPRSGLALKHGITVLNTPGTIDADFRNGWGIILMNLGNDPFIVKQGDRIAQAVLCKKERVEWNEVDSLDESVRGLGGFGHTGV